jgi:hypothetical protein
VHDPLVHRPLDLVEQRLALHAVALVRLLPEQVVDVRVPAVGVGSVADDERLQACRSVTLRRGSRWRWSDMRVQKPKKRSGEE